MNTNLSWQPIKTAPKNSADSFLVGRSRKKGVPAVAQVISIDGRFVQLGMGPFLKPTHWMPLPEAPL